MRRCWRLLIGPVAEQTAEELERTKKGEWTVVLSDTQKVTLRIEPRNKKGNLATLDGVPQWSSGDPNVVSVKPSVDGLSCVVLAGQAGSTQVSVTADADLDAGEARQLTGTIDFQVMPGEAITMGIVAGAPEEQ